MVFCIEKRMKKFELTLIERDLSRDFQLKSSDRIEADDLMQLLMQLTFIINNINRRQLEEEIRKVTSDANTDDIPF